MLLLFLNEGDWTHRKTITYPRSKGPFAALLGKGELVGAKPAKIDI